jgi:hypothetical protein
MAQGDGGVDFALLNDDVTTALGHIPAQSALRSREGLSKQSRPVERLLAPADRPFTLGFPRFETTPQPRSA